MKELSLIFCLCVLLVLFSSCAPDLTDDVEWAYDVAKNNSGSGSGSSSGSCTITEDGKMWSPMSSSTMSWDDAVSYCNNLTECGYSDWHLPTISELRTLIKNCSGTVTVGSCGVTDSCLSSSGCRNDPCDGCSYDSSGYYSKLGDSDSLWSSSTKSDSSSNAWRVYFLSGSVLSYGKSNGSNFRCVR